MGSKLSTGKKQILVESTVPIYEEIEIDEDEHDDLMSENNFYSCWDNHKRLLLSQDEQLKLLNEDSRSQSANLTINEAKGIRKSRPWKRSHRRKEDFLDPIEEKKDDPQDDNEN